MSASLVLAFQYRDERGVVSERIVGRFHKAPAYIVGFDLGERAERTFRLDRITVWRDGSEALLADAPPPLPRSPRHDDAPRAGDILFTGFSRAVRDDLERGAEAIGLIVRESVTKHLEFLCAGPNAGPAKLARARAIGATVLTPEAFMVLLHTGELPPAD